MAISFLSGQSIDGNVTIATSGLTDNLILTSTDTSAASAPDIVLYRNAAIADSDTLGVVEYKGKNGMVPSSGTPLTYNAIYSRIADASNNQSILTLSAHKGNGSGSFIHAVNVSAIGTNNSATGAILINPTNDFSLPAYNLDVNGTAYISSSLLINGDLSLDNITNASSDTDKFVVADIGVIKYRTGAQVLSDIGAAPATGGAYLPLAGGTMTGNINFNNSVRELKWNHTSGQSGSRAYGFIGEQGAYGRFALRSSNAADNVLDTDVLVFDNDLSASFAGDVSLANLKSIYLGTSSALRIYTDSASAYIRGNDVRLTNASNQNIFKVNTNVAELYYSDSKRFETTAGGTVNTGTIDSTGTITVTGANGNVGINTDSGKLLLGASYDLQIYHDGNDSYISDAGTGLLFIRASSALRIQGANGESMIDANENGAVNLYYDNSIKFATTSTGAKVTGNLGVGMTPTEVLDIKTNSGDCRMRLDAPSGSDTEVKFFNAGAAQYTIGHDDDTDNFVIGGANVDTPLVSVNKAGVLIINGGNISLSGTGRIQGIDTVSDGTDAANKTYVDTAVAGAGSGTFLPLAGGTMTGLITDLETANDLVTGRTGAGNIYAKDSGNTFWQVFKSGSATYMTTAGTSSDSIYLGAPTSSVTTNLVASGNIQTGNTGDGSLTLKQSGTTFMQMFKVGGSSGSFINTGTGGDTIHFGNTTGLVCNVNVTGFLDADNFKINGFQGTSGQVLTSSGSGVSWQTPSIPSGVTGFGAANKLAVWSSGTNIINTKITDNSGFYALDNYTATAVSTTGPIDPNQNAQAASQDTLATLSVDPTGNIVRGEQEATFTFTLAQLNATLGQTLISAPGAGKAVVITYTDWMMKYSSTGSVNNQLEIRQANLAQTNASVSVLPALRFNEIVNQSQSGSAPFYGFYTRDIPTGSGSQGRTYAVNKATTFHKQTSSPYPSGLTSISIKIRYRIFDVSTF